MTDEEAVQPGLAARVEALERTVELLERRLETIDQPGRREHVTPAPRPPVFRPASRPTIALVPADPGQWVNRLGIALLLLGAAFGFRYSIDRGWIPPSLRVLAGFALGAALIRASPVIRDSRPGLSRILAGGGVAAWYLSIFAAFQLYHLVSHPVAFGAMTLVTALAFVVSVRQKDATSAIVGAIGGFATPFVLYTGERSLSGLVVYTCLILSGAVAVYARQGWNLLLATAAAGSWVIIAGAAIESGRDSSMSGVVVELGAIFTALATWWFAVVRELLVEEDPVHWIPSSYGVGDGPRRFGLIALPEPHQLILATPLLMLATTKWVWSLDSDGSGWTAATIAAGWAVAGLHLLRIGTAAARRLSSTHVVAAAAMLAISISLLAGDDAQRVGLAAEGLALVVLAPRLESPAAAVLGHVLLILTATTTCSDILGALTSTRLVAGDWASLAVIGMLAAAAIRETGAFRQLHFLLMQGNLLLWLMRVFEPRPGGRSIVTALWFADAVLLVVAGLRSDSASLRAAGAAVMGLTMLKLFVLDLATVDPAWRVIVFLGFGLVLLGLGYAFPSLWRRGARAASAEPLRD